MLLDSRRQEFIPNIPLFYGAAGPRPARFYAASSPLDPLPDPTLAAPLKTQTPALSPPHVPPHDR